MDQDFLAYIFTVTCIYMYIHFINNIISAADTTTTLQYVVNLVFLIIKLMCIPCTEKSHTKPKVLEDTLVKKHHPKFTKWILQETLFNNDIANPTHHQFVYTVPRYPDNHNPLIPLSLQQQLDNMNPREFLTYVLKDLTLEERESLMVDERQRRKTFLVSWPYDDQRSGVKMAQAGFYSLDDYDRVQCVFCRGSLHKWDAGDTPMIEHARSFPFCRFVKGLICGNREYRSNRLSRADIRNITIFTSGMNKRQDKIETIIDSNLLGISTNHAATIQYAPIAARYKTYARWPASCPITAQRMCEAGYYFTGFDDQVRCFYCSGGIKQWSDGDDPWEEHARWFPDCAFLVQQKGQPYVDEVHARTPATRKRARPFRSQETPPTKKAKYKTNALLEMRAVCLKLGHSPETIDKALAIHGKPFESINSMIDALYEVEGNNSDDGHGSTSVRPSACLDSRPITSTDLNITLTKAASAEHAPLAARMQTLKDWPMSSTISVEKMCEAGFYYSTLDDEVFCFSCGGGIAKWREDDDPWEEHARWYPDCEFLIQQKGHAYIDNVRKNTPVGRNFPRKVDGNPPVEKKAKSSSPQRKFQTGCIICERMSGGFIPATHIGLPCGHLLFCEQCNNNTAANSGKGRSYCPLDNCGAKLTGTVRFYFA